MPRPKGADLRSLLVALRVEADGGGRLEHVGGLRRDADRVLRRMPPQRGNRGGAQQPVLVAGKGVQLGAEERAAALGAAVAGPLARGSCTVNAQSGWGRSSSPESAHPAGSGGEGRAGGGRSGTALRYRRRGGGGRRAARRGGRSGSATVARRAVSATPAPR